MKLASLTVHSQTLLGRSREPYGEVAIAINIVGYPNRLWSLMID